MKKYPVYIIILLSIILSISFHFYINSKNQQKIIINQDKIKDTINKMQLKSVFNNNERIPQKYTCNGEDTNPPLEILNPPENTKSFVLIIDDPDAPVGVWDHWILFNIPKDTQKIQENSIPDNAVQGINDFKKLNYGGPCPPSGTHRYFFKLYALDTTLNLPEGSTKQQVIFAMQNHILDKTELIGLYSQNS